MTKTFDFYPVCLLIFCSTHVSSNSGWQIRFIRDCPIIRGLTGGGNSSGYGELTVTWDDNSVSLHGIGNANSKYFWLFVSLSG